MIKPGFPYLLTKVVSPIAMGQGSKSSSPTMEVTFEIDPSESKIVDEHMKLANYLLDRFLTIDIFDVTTKFFYGSCKIPLHDLLR